MIIKTKDFTLRPIRISDAKEYWEIMQDNETKKGFTTIPKNFSEAKKEVKEMLAQIKEKDSEIFTILINNKYAGQVTLEHQNWDKSNNEGRVHILIHPNYRGKGLATKSLKTILKYGFEKKKFKRIFAQCKASNKAVIKVNKKCGFKKVKTYITKKDKYHKGGIKKILWVKQNL